MISGSSLPIDVDSFSLYVFIFSILGADVLATKSTFRNATVSELALSLISLSVPSPLDLGDNGCFVFFFYCFVFFIDCFLVLSPLSVEL